jgi:hypothetical protein
MLSFRRLSLEVIYFRKTAFARIKPGQAYSDLARVRLSEASSLQRLAFCGSCRHLKDLARRDRGAALHRAKQVSDKP